MKEAAGKKWNRLGVYVIMMFMVAHCSYAGREKMHIYIYMYTHFAGSQNILRVAAANQRKRRLVICEADDISFRVNTFKNR